MPGVCIYDNSAENYYDKAIVCCTIITYYFLLWNYRFMDKQKTNKRKYLPDSL